MKEHHEEAGHPNPSDAAANAARPPSAASAAIPPTLTETQKVIEDRLDSLLDNLPDHADAIEAQAAVKLKLRPQPDLILALSFMGRPGQGSEQRSQLVRKLVLIRLLVDTHLKALTGTARVTPASLKADSRSIMTLIELVSALRHEFGNSVLELPHHDGRQFRGLMRTLMPATDRLHSYALLITMLEPLAQAAEAGRLNRFTGLKSAEAARFTAALQPECGGGSASRVILDTLALRCGMQQDLQAWVELPPPTAADDDVTTISDDPSIPLAEMAPGATPRDELLRRLRLDMSVYNVLLERIQFQQSATLAAGDKAAFNAISGVQNLLFAVYQQVAGVVRNPLPQSNSRTKAEVEQSLDQMFQEASAAESLRPEEQTEEQVYLEALTEMQKHTAPDTGTTSSLRPSTGRDRRRRTMLMACAMMLAVIAAGVNYTLWQSPESTPAPPLAAFAPAMPLATAQPMGPAMYARLPAFNWNAMSTLERQKRVALLGQLATDRGFLAVVLVDEDHRDLARWSRSGGVTLAPEPNQQP